MSAKQLKVFDSRKEGFKYYDERLDELLSSLRKSIDVYFMGDDKARSGEVVRSVFEHVSEYLKKRSDAIRESYSKSKSSSSPIEYRILQSRENRDIEKLREGYEATIEVYKLYDELMRLFDDIITQIEETRNKYPDFQAVAALIHNIDESKANSLVASLKNDLSSKIDFTRMDQIIREIESNTDKMKNKVTFFIPSEQRATNLKDYMSEIVIKLCKQVRQNLEGKSKTNIDIQKVEVEKIDDSKKIKSESRIEKLFEYIDSKKIDIVVPIDLKGDLIEYDRIGQVIELINACKFEYQGCSSFIANLDKLLEDYMRQRENIDKDISRKLRKFGFRDLESFEKEYLGKVDEITREEEAREGKRRSMDIFKAEYLRGTKTRKDVDKFAQEIGLTLAEMESFLYELSNAKTQQMSERRQAEAERDLKDIRRAERHEQVEKIAKEIFAAKLKTFRYEDDPAYASRDMEDPGYYKAVRELYKEAYAEAERIFDRNEERKKQEPNERQEQMPTEIDRVRRLVEPYKTDTRKILYQEYYLAKLRHPKISKMSFSDYLITVHADPEMITKEKRREAFASELYARYSKNTMGMTFSEYQRMYFKSNGIQNPLEFDEPIINQPEEERKGRGSL